MDDLETQDLSEEIDEDGIAGINITPLVDVALTLVLVFMVAMPLSAVYGIQVRRHILERYGLTTPQESVQVHLTDEAVLVKDSKGKEKKIAPAEVGAVLAQMMRDSTGKRLLLQCDRDVPHGQTVWVMDLAKQNGASDISLLGG